MVGMTRLERAIIPLGPKPSRLPIDLHPDIKNKTVLKEARQYKTIPLPLSIQL